MDIHDKIAEALFQKKSMAAFIWLINQGRELEFSYNKIDFFVSRDNSMNVVSLWAHKEEQAFDSVEDLLENAIIENERFCDIWENISLGILF